MRNGQNKQRVAGCSGGGGGGGGGHNQNRRGQNPLTRVYELNGPEIKICGTASHIAEKYLQLARDAQGSGDPVSAENYYQHAEHYFRIIAAAQEQFRQNQPPQQPPPQRIDNDMRDENADEADADFSGFGGEQGSQVREPQPYPVREQQSYQTRDQQQPPREQQNWRDNRNQQPQPSTGSDDCYFIVCRRSSPAGSRSRTSAAATMVMTTAPMAIGVIVVMAAIVVTAIPHRRRLARPWRPAARQPGVAT